MKHLRVPYFIAANTAILIILAQVTTHLAIRTYDLVVPPLLVPAMSEAVRRNYAHMAPADVDELMRVTTHLRFRYAPVVGFLPDLVTSRFVNVDAHGIRANGPSPRAIGVLQDAIWFLGGSTAFGFGVADHETIPAQLEVVMGQPVVNLGVSNYSSTEENLLLNHYLRIGYRPAVAIFLDGINETCEPDLYQEEMRTLVGRAQEGYSWDVGGPVTYAYARLSRKLRRLRGIAVDQIGHQTLTCVRDGKQNALSTIHARTLAERAALCRLYDIVCRTIVQPFAGLHGRRDGFEASFLEADAAQLATLFGHLEPNWRAASALFVTDVLDHYDRHAFIDEVHYSAAASRLLAETIASRLGAP